MILSICAVAFGLSGAYAAPVIALLAAATFSALTQLLEGRRSACALSALASTSCAFFPTIFCASPLFLYDALRLRKPWLAAPAALGLCRLYEFQPVQIALVVVGCGASLVVYKRTHSLETAVGKLSALSDEGRETNLRLKEKNYRLIEAQDDAARIATLKERNRIAREIHDNVGHMLTRSLLQAGALQIINKDENMKEPLESLRSTLDCAMTNIRQSVHDLHDDSIDLEKVLEEALAPAKQRFDVKFEYDVSGEISGRVKLCAAGVVREAVSNSLKYSSGSRFSAVFREHPAFYQLVVEDDGSCASIRETGIGLKNMEDRVASVGGTINFSPSEKGFRIFTTIPKEKGGAV